MSIEQFVVLRPTIAQKHGDLALRLPRPRLKLAFKSTTSRLTHKEDVIVNDLVHMLLGEGDFLVLKSFVIATIAGKVLVERLLLV